MTWTREFKRGTRGRFFGGLFRWSWLLAIEPALARHLTALTTGWIHELTDVVALRLGSDQRARTDARLAVGALTGSSTPPVNCGSAVASEADPQALIGGFWGD